MKDRLDEAIEYAENKLENCDKSCGCGCNLECMGNPKKELKVLKLYNNLFSNKDIGIQLKNIDLSSVKPNEQMKKFNEEVEEFIIAVEEHNYMALKCKSHMIEEFWDVVQSGLGLLHFEGVEADEVMSGYQAHLDKMESRGNKPREKVQK